MNFENNVINQEPNTQLATINDRILALKAKAEQSIELWTAYPGSTICGSLFSKRQVQTQFALQEQFVLKDESGNLVAYWLSKYIEGQLRAQGANYNDLIAITSHGQRQTSNGKTYNAFTVLVDHING